MPANPPRAPGELADEVEAMLKSMRPEDIAAGSGFQPLMGFTGPEWCTILASLRSATGDGGEAKRAEAPADNLAAQRDTPSYWPDGSLKHRWGKRKGIAQRLCEWCGQTAGPSTIGWACQATFRPDLALQPRSTKIEGAGDA